MGKSWYHDAVNPKKTPLSLRPFQSILVSDPMPVGIPAFRSLRLRHLSLFIMILQEPSVPYHPSEIRAGGDTYGSVSKTTSFLS